MKVKNTIKNITAYQTPLFDEEGFLKLDSNESDFGPSTKVLDAIKQISAEDIKFYPFYGELLEKLSEIHNVSIDNIILTAGADEAISAILSTFIEINETVLTVTPSFVMPKIYSKINGLNYTEISYKDKWVFPIEEFINEIDKADFIHLTTPNSPTGEIIEKNVIDKIVQKAENKPILIDETYGNYSGITNVDYIKSHQNIFIVRSFSKDFALAGLRLGYIISDSENILQLRKYLSPYNVSSITVKAGVAALSDFDYFKNVKNEIEISKNKLADLFSKLGADVYDSQTNFLFVDFKQKADFVYKKLLDNKIKVRRFSDEGLKNCFRITIPKSENVEKIMNALDVKPTIVFDMDGVIVDASKSYRVAVQKTFNHFSGKEISPDEICDAKKIGGLNNDWDLTNYLLKKYGFEIEYDKIVENFQTHYSKLADVEEILITKDFLDNLCKNYNLAIFTGRLPEEAEFTLNKYEIKDYFYPIITMKDVGLDHQKPDIRGIEILKEKIISKEIIYLGDTVDDMICAKNAKVIGVGILPPQDKSNELNEVLKSKDAITVLEKAMDLPSFLEKNQICKDNQVCLNK